MICGIREQLMEAWTSATIDLSVAAERLADLKLGETSPVVFQELRGRAEAARLASENARMSFVLHCKTHGCV